MKGSSMMQEKESAMRKILFKARRVSDGMWLYGRYDDEQGAADFPCILPTENKDIAGCDWRIDPATLCQYTGITDKNGVKIFEGDIAKLDDFNVEVAWWIDAWCVSGGFLTADGLGCYNERMEVIGNIHDNDSLRKEMGK